MDNLRSYDDMVSELNGLTKRYYAIEDSNMRRVFRVNYIALALSIIGGFYSVMKMKASVGDTIATTIVIMVLFFIASCIVGNMIRNRFSDYKELDKKIDNLSHAMRLHSQYSVKNTVAREYGLNSTDSITLNFFDRNRVNEYWKANYFIKGKAMEVIVAYDTKSHSSSIANSAPTF